VAAVGYWALVVTVGLLAYIPAALAATVAVAVALVRYRKTATVVMVLQSSAFIFEVSK
jgi:hypothetical protein